MALPMQRQNGRSVLLSPFYIGFGIGSNRPFPPLRKRSGEVCGSAPRDEIFLIIMKWSPTLRDGFDMAVDPCDQERRLREAGRPRLMKRSPPSCPSALPQPSSRILSMPHWVMAQNIPKSRKIDLSKAVRHFSKDIYHLLLLS